MERSELMAAYDNFDKEITTIDCQEFYDNFDKESNHHYSISATSVQEYSIDGYNYYIYSTTYNVGWQGDMDCDIYYCKVKTMTKAERDDIRKLLTSPGFGY